jgi:endonuclease/exonuclease/phosphatase family metal-dependent hydrolase
MFSAIPSTTEPRLRLCTWNLHLGLELDEVLASLADEDFRELDLLALQEASVEGSTENAAAIAARLGPDYRHHQVKAHVLRGRVQANALVWNSKRIEVRSQDVIHLPQRLERGLPRAERALLRMTPLQQRSALVFDCRLGTLSLQVCVAHLDVFGYQHKLRQFARVLAALDVEAPADITVIAGDLNTFRMGRRPRWTRMREAAEAAGFDDLTSDIKWTHRPRMPSRQKLDAIFLRCERSLEYRSWSVDLPGSDHIPVFAEVLGWAD